MTTINLLIGSLIAAAMLLGAVVYAPRCTSNSPGLYIGGIIKVTGC